jgi:ribosomal protein S18 acetylase RimI-like enzyme
MEIQRLSEATEQDAIELSKLAVALHGDERSMSVIELKDLILDGNVDLFVARDGGRIVGMGAIYFIRKIGSNKCYMEDLIVDETYRGKGVGSTLLGALIEAARKRKARALEFGTRVTREDAHRFYERNGFKKKDRFIYSLAL